MTHRIQRILELPERFLQVVEAIQANRFLLLTHPDLQDELVKRASDPEAFIEGQLAVIREQDA
jgi:hypothetical protein